MSAFIKKRADMTRRNRRKDIAPVFKEYNQDQLIMFPPSIEELIPENHLVRVVDSILRLMNISPLLRKYKGGGTSSYHPEMMLKVIVYAYTCHIYSSRQIAKALRENIAFMWLSGGNKPDFRTINNFRSGILGDAIEEVFAVMTLILLEKGYINLANLFIDGTKLEADANRHGVVWSKNTKRYKEISKEHIREILRQIKEINDKENREYGECDLEELGGREEINSTDIERVVQTINERLKDKESKDKTDKTIERLGRKIEKEYLPKIKKYEKQEEIAGGRKSYSTTDKDASVVMMKDGRLLPGYNVQIGTENQFIANYSIHTNAGDSGLFKAHLEKLKELTGLLPGAVIGDSAYGSEENYSYCEENGIDAYLKYNLFHKEKENKFKTDISKKENMTYHAIKDEYECAGGRILKFKEEREKHTDNGFKYSIRRYECISCDGCILSSLCKKTKGNRTIDVNKKLNYHRWKARRLLDSEKGIILRKKRSIDVESVFGDIKRNMKFNRFSLRGIHKVNCEFGLISMAHNIKKIFKIQLEAIQNHFFIYVLAT